MSETNPYAAPCSAVATADEFGDVKIFSFSGRIGRLRYLAFNMVMVFVLYFAIVIIAAITLPRATGDMTLITLLIGLLSLASLPIGLMFTIQRLHDMSACGWWSLLIFVPVVNALLGLVLLFAPGIGGSNRFGQQPKPNGAGVLPGRPCLAGGGCGCGGCRRSTRIQRLCLPGPGGSTGELRSARTDKRRRRWVRGGTILFSLSGGYCQLKRKPPVYRPLRTLPATNNLGLTKKQPVAIRTLRHKLTVLT